MCLAREYLTISNLIPLRKKHSNTPRPIAISEVFYRAAASYVCSQVSLAASAHCGPHQLGIHTKDGAGKLHMKLQAKISDPNGKTCIFLGDFKNAFNCIDRAHVLNEVYADSSLEPAFRFVNWAYGKESQLRVNSETTIASQQGVKQGDSNGSWLFAVGVHPAYRKAAAKHDDVDLDAYAWSGRVCSCCIGDRPGFSLRRRCPPRSVQ